MNRPLLLVNIVAILVGVAYGMHNPILPVFATTIIGASYAELGLIGLANFVPYMFIPLMVGFLLDRFNNGHLLMIGIAINTSSLYLLSIAQSVPEIMGYRVLTGIAHAFFWPPSEAIISEYSDRKKRVHNIAKFTSFFVAGYAIGPLIASFMLIDGHGASEEYRTIFAASAYVIAAAIISSIYVSKMNTKERIQKWSLDALRKIAHFPEVVIMILYCTAVFGMILTIYPAFLHERGITDVEIGILYFAFGAARIVTLFTMKKSSPKSRMVFVTVASAIAASLLISYFAEGMIAFAIAMLLMGYGFSIIFPIMLDAVLGNKKSDTDGSMIGVFEMIFGIGWAIGPLVAGLLSQFYGGAAPYAAFFVAGVAITIMLIMRRNHIAQHSSLNP